MRKNICKNICKFKNTYVSLQRQIIRTSNNIKHINSMKALNKQQETYLYLVLQFRFIKPIENMLENLNDGTYKYGDSQAMKTLNETLQECVNCLLECYNIKMSCPQVKGKLNRESKEQFIKYFNQLKEVYQDYANAL